MQTGAKYLARRKRESQDKEVVCTSHYKPEISIPVKDGVRKRPRCLKRKAD